MDLSRGEIALTFGDYIAFLTGVTALKEQISAFRLTEGLDAPVPHFHLVESLHQKLAQMALDRPVPVNPDDLFDEHAYLTVRDHPARRGSLLMAFRSVQSYSKDTFASYPVYDIQFISARNIRLLTPQ